MGEKEVVPETVHRKVEVTVVSRMVVRRSEVIRVPTVETTGRENQGGVRVVRSGERDV